MLERGLTTLRLGEAQLAAAHLRVQLVLLAVDDDSARLRLGPEVARVGRVAAELEADQVILLVRRRRPAQPVLTEPSTLEVIRVGNGRPDRACPAAPADRRSDRRRGDV